MAVNVKTELGSLMTMLRRGAKVRFKKRMRWVSLLCFFFQAEDGIRDIGVTGIQTCALSDLAWFFSAVITLGLWLVLPGAQSERLLWGVFRAASVGVWFAPACILLSQLSPASLLAALVRSEERRVGKEWRSRWSPYHSKKKQR